MKKTIDQIKKNMQAVKASGSKIEKKMGRELWAEGYRYRKNYKNIVGKPDFVLISSKIAIFCDSEFWHGYDWKNKKKEIKTNKIFWIKKIERNIERDKEVNKLLRKKGWMVLRFWGKDIEKDMRKCIKKINKAVESKKKMKYSEIKNVLNIKINNKTDEELAYFTHYLHTYKSKDALNYKNKAVECFNKYVNKYLIVKNLRNINSLFPINWDVPYPPNDNHKFKFIDLFAGIGGFRLAFQKLGGKRVFSSEINEYAKITYEANFGEVPFGDITKISEYNIPNHNILCAGFPCQAFSIAGKRGGFNDTRGTLFFDIARILKTKKPDAFFLENVKGLKNHMGGKTLNIILNVLRNDLNYYVPDPQIINAKYYGVPQNRERIFIIGFKNKSKGKKFKYPNNKAIKKYVKHILELEVVSSKYYLSTQYLKTLREHRRRHEEKGHGFGYEVIDNGSIANAIVVGGMGRERNLVIDKRLKDFTPVTKIIGEVNKEGIRRMTPREWARLQGYGDKYKIIVSDVQAYKQFGNSVAIPAVIATGKKIVNILKEK